MKKILALILAIAAVMSFAACTGGETESTTTTKKTTTTTTRDPGVVDPDPDDPIIDEGYDPDVYLPYVETPISIDGVKEEAWNAAQPITLDIAIKDSPEATVTAYQMYDDEYLYFFFEMEDADLSQADIAGGYLSDGIYLYISETNDFGVGADSYSNGTYQFAIINEELSMIPRKGLAEEIPAENYKVSTNFVEGSETFTIEFCYKPAFLELAKGSQFSLDYQYNDCADGTRKGALSWYRTKDGDADPTNMGIAELLGKDETIPE